MKKLMETFMDLGKLKTEKIIGKPIELEERTLIPIILTSIHNSWNRNRGSGGGALGLFITPIAFVLIGPKYEKVLSLYEKELTLPELMEAIPGLEDLLREVKEKKRQSLQI
jgi:uncharacterized spore protein YtfJ